MLPKETFLKLFGSYYQTTCFFCSSALSQADPSQMCFSVSRLVENDRGLTSGMCSALYCGTSLQKRRDKITQNYSMPVFKVSPSKRILWPLTVKHQHIKANITTNRHCGVYTTQIYHTSTKSASDPVICFLKQPF